MFDRSEPILESVNDVKFTLLLTVGLVVLVIFLFLRNVSATLIPSLALPISVIGTFAAMKLLGYTLDNLSLMALTLSVGFVVDDAIVVLENIVRHMEMGKNRMTAAFDGAREIGFTVLSMTLSLAAVFIPVLFMGGIIGRLFHEFAVDHHGRDPDLRLRLHQSDPHAVQPVPAPSFRRTRRALQSIGESVGRLPRSLRLDAAGRDAAFRPHHAGGGGDSGRDNLPLGIVPKGFIPPMDTGQLSGTTEGRQDVSYDRMLVVQHRPRRFCEEIPTLKHSAPWSARAPTMWGAISSA